MFSGYEALKGPKEVSGFEGDSVSLQCTYEKKVRGHRKYWCRESGLILSRCSDIVYSKQNQEVVRGRMSILDRPRELSMTVTMTDLTVKDSGKYWCGIDRLGFDESFEVSLIVFPGNERLSPWPGWDGQEDLNHGKFPITEGGRLGANLIRPSLGLEELVGTPAEHWKQLREASVVPLQVSLLGFHRANVVTPVALGLVVLGETG